MTSSSHLSEVTPTLQHLHPILIFFAHHFLPFLLFPHLFLHLEPLHLFLVYPFIFIPVNILLLGKNLFFTLLLVPFLLTPLLFVLLLLALFFLNPFLLALFLLQHLKDIIPTTYLSVFKCNTQ